jgi:hypothetical protein
MMSNQSTDQRVDHFGLAPCPFCGGKAFFHGRESDPDCSGCHHIECSNCKVMVDYGTPADPGNSAFALTQLRRLITPLWNRRAPKDIAS